MTAAGLKPGKPAKSHASKSYEYHIAPVWVMPQGAPIALRSKMWLDYQNDVKVSDVQLAAREGYESVEHTKRYTTLGMATDQGKLSNINGLAVLAEALDEDIPQVGTTTFRPPYTPVTLGALAGEARGEIFQPLRRTPMHDWHEENRGLLRTRRPLAPPLLLPARRRNPRTGRPPRGPEHPQEPRPARRLDPWQDHRQGAGRGALPRHALHRRDVARCRSANAATG